MNEVMNIEDRSLTAAEVKGQVQLIQEVMEGVMKEGIHYGVIPGCQKPSLYKAGSEKILSTFRIAVDPEVEDLSTPDKVHYRLRVRGINMGTGTFLGAGIGECSSDEEKYMWRRAVCPEEFDATPPERRRKKWFKGYQNKSATSVDQVRTNPADVANTILKMAKKRGQMDMTLTVTAASDVFDQDTEDLPEGMVVDQKTTQKSKTSTVQKRTPDKGKGQEKTDGDVKNKFKSLLRAFCGGDMLKMQELQKELTMFNDQWVDDVDAATDKRIKVAFDKLTKKISTECHKDCNYDPESCGQSAEDNGTTFCCASNKECPFQAE